jgi:TatD DNase family protein
MIIVDTHTHLYEDAFDADRTAMIQRAIDEGVSQMIIPNVDSTTVQPILDLVHQFPGHVFPMIGLHPCYVKHETYKSELEVVRRQLFENASVRFVAVGEIGIDLYWDKTTFGIQREAFEMQCDWAMEKDLPVAIHSRESTGVLIDILQGRKENPGGVFHCFTGTLEEANELIKLGFRLGIGGVITFKNTHLREVLKQIPIDHILIETDSPYLSPVPYRGKRNESAYCRIVAETLAAVYNRSVDDIASITTRNARSLFEI